MALTVENICGLLIRSRLQSPDAVRSIYQHWTKETKDSGDLKTFAKWLVAKNYLTDYQATLLTNGHADNFFLGQYKILDRIGKGRMAGVYKAVHALGQVVAIKVLPPSKAKDPLTLGRFQREARLAMQLAHPSIVRTFQVGESDGLHYIVMEHLEGVTLEDLLKQRRLLPPREAVRFTFLAALGLQYLHEKGMVHRDLKPGNLMLCPAPGALENTLRSMVKILDIGLARTLFDPRAKEGGDALTGEGVVLGTPNYLAPEQARDARRADIRSDIYSLGCTLYHALTGQPPFVDDNPIRLILRHASEQPRPPKELSRDVPDELGQIVLRMLAKDPTQRPDSPAKVVDALKKFLVEAEPPKKVDPAEMKSYLEWLNKGGAVPTATPAQPHDAGVSMFPLPTQAKQAPANPKPPPSAERVALLKQSKRRLSKLKQQKLLSKKLEGQLAARLINVEPVSASDLAPTGFRARDFFMVMLGALSVLGVVLLLVALNHLGYLSGLADLLNG